MLQNAYFLAKIGADTAENEQHSAEILLKTGGGVEAASPVVQAGAHPELLAAPRRRLRFWVGAAGQNLYSA